MESIRILQDTYEKLYVLTAPISNLMQDVFPKWKGDTGWKPYCDKLLDNVSFWKRREWSNFCELDLYLLLHILKNSWTGLKECFGDFFNDDNERLFVSDSEFSVLSIRNTVAHPENMEPLTAYYHLPHDKTNQKYIKYKKWDESLEEAAHALGFSLGEEICRVHQKEKEELEKVIFENSTFITMNSPEWKNDILSADVKAGIKRTRERIETQSTAAGIMDFFKDAQFLGKGQNIKEELEKYNLPTFESIWDKIWLQYYGFTK